MGHNLDPACQHPWTGWESEARKQKSRCTASQPGHSSNPPGGLLRGRPPNTQHPRWARASPTFDDVCVIQRQLPQQLVLAGRVNDAGCRVPVGSNRGALAKAGERAQGRTTASSTLATHRLMELRRREPDFRFRVVQTMRSVNRKRDRSFLPPTAFCGARDRIQAQRPSLLPTLPKGDSQARRGGPSRCPEANWDLILGSCWGGRAGGQRAAAVSREGNQAGRWGQGGRQWDTSYHFNDHLLPQEPPQRGLELWGRRDKAS